MTGWTVRWWPMLFFLAGALWGCTPKLEPLSPIAGSQLDRAQVLLHYFLNQQRETALDADVRLHWDMPGRKGGLDGILQLQAPGNIRLTVLDPLGRQEFILVIDTNHFTMVDNRQGKGYVGEMDTEKRYEYLPAILKGDELFALLGGFLPSGSCTLNSVESIGKTREKQDTWYQFNRIDRTGTVRFTLEDSGSMMKRCLFVDGHNETPVTVRYEGVAPSENGEVLWPKKVTISGSSLHGEYQLSIVKILSLKPLPSSAFSLKIPPGYTVTRY
ncbi:MAG: hypothetical protein CSA32_04290 [Desulfobulbus propionicus]|nr:MAG: hypothetical protein CSA32_04290 [Desulfobulbus propionicus]